MSRDKLPPYKRKKSTNIAINQRKISTMGTHIIPEHYAVDLPQGMVALENQVAGHTFQSGTDAIGLLKDQHDGSIMKPASKPMCGAREIGFYESLVDAKHEDLVFLKDLVPEYRGTTKLQLGGRDIDFIKLTNLTHGMIEPCIMDIKIGKRTWDPLASKEKREAEEQKYLECKHNLGLCIPGFQVHSITTGKCKKFDKDYGKKLNQKSIKDALRIFLNSEAGLSRGLLMQFLSGLWKVQKWARTQKLVKLYSSSLLLVYDARRLRNSLQCSKKNGALISPGNSNLSLQEQGVNGTGTPFQFPVERKISEPVQCYQRVQRSHSSQNNFDKDLQSIPRNYNFMMDNLIAMDENKEWAFIKMIDFAHVFPSEDDTLDTNYLFGVDNLVKLFEEFLKECE